MHPDSQNFDVLGGIGNNNNLNQERRKQMEDQRKELQLQRVLLSERIMRLQAEFELARMQITEVEKKIAELPKEEEVKPT